MNVGLVLSGGMAKGAYQIGALQAINEFLSPCNMSFCSCASIGVLNGYAYMTGKLDAAEKMWRRICNSDSRMIIGKVLRSSMLQQNINNIYSVGDAIKSTFYTTLLDLNGKSVSYIDLSRVESELLPLYLKASVAMPVYNKSVHIGNRFFFDGAMVDNIPIYPLVKHSIDYIICIYFDDCGYTFEDRYLDNKVIKIVFRTKSTLKQSVVFKNNSIDEMLTTGYESTKLLLSTIFANGTDNLNHIHKSISYINSSFDNKKLRITGDMLVTNLNKVTQRLTHRNIVE